MGSIDMNTFFGPHADHLKAEDLKGKEVSVVIDGWRVMKFDDGEKVALTFQGKDKDMILNKTNGGRLLEEYGADPANWIGKTIILFSEMVQFAGNMVPGLRVRIPPKEVGKNEEAVPF